MAEIEVSEKEIIAFIEPIQDLLEEQAGKKIVVVGVGTENKALAKKLYDTVDGSVFSEIVVEGNTPTFEACMYGGEPDIIVIVTNHQRVGKESPTANVAVRLLREKTGHIQVVGAIPGSAAPASDTLASKAIIISTSGPIQSEFMNSVGGGVVNFGDLDASAQFVNGLKKITGKKSKQRIKFHETS